MWLSAVLFLTMVSTLLEALGHFGPPRTILPTFIPIHLEKRSPRLSKRLSTNNSKMSSDMGSVPDAKTHKRYKQS